MTHPLEAVPKILYAAVRRRAHPVVMERGLGSQGHTILTADRETAVRIGSRKDDRPVVLEIMASAARKAGVSFYGFGRLFLSGDIPHPFISGPPLPKETEETREKKPPAPAPAAHAPGTFLFAPDKDPDLLRRTKGKKRKGWKEEARKLRRR